MISYQAVVKAPELSTDSYLINYPDSPLHSTLTFNI